MKAFQSKPELTTLTYADDIKKPSLNSVLAQKKRMRALHESAVAESDESYTSTEVKLMAEAKAMSVVGHLEELRARLLIAAFAFIVGFGICYYFVEDIFAFLVAPAGKLYYMRPTEAFFAYMKVAAVSGFLLASPLILYQAWAFIKPALTKGEKEITNWVLPVILLLFAIGVCFSYFLVLPAAIRFFIGFSTDELQPMFSIGQYIDFMVAFILPFGLIFELPLVMMLLAKLNFITSSMLKDKRKFFILFAFIIGGVVSPTPDVFSQSMIAMPMIILYEISLRIIKHGMKK